ncbi:patatin-like phospholipase family protein [Nocardioides nitrophenolicus]|uniref:patatin-like phospholipase family protein n=1 Tax=Nocardioides nitrophenolicus TaxID=60489 RepID=UPI00196009CB|nr:patatin-like phospholipase family protein [Nocardioides nitrophenolicus]MBM7520493.1 NTE family protein [Nocardioides nitrophenolicus]
MSRSRALVLGGGGATGNAWLVGVVAGLLEEGVDVMDAGLVVGTSAGSTTAVQLCGVAATELLDAVLEAPVPRRPARPRPARAVPDQLERIDRIIAAATDPADLRRRLGAAALELAGDGSWQERWRSTVAARLPDRHWPARKLLVTTVDAATGEPVELDRHSGVDLVDAVAASCSSGPAYRIGERSYIDGGYRANADNADLALGCERVLVLSPFGGRSRAPAAWGLHLASQVARLRSAGSRVETVLPEAEELFGRNAMDLSLRPAAARAGRDQGRASAARVGALWS